MAVLRWLALQWPARAAMPRGLGVGEGVVDMTTILSSPRLPFGGASRRPGVRVAAPRG